MFSVLVLKFVYVFSMSETKWMASRGVKQVRICCCSDKAGMFKCCQLKSRPELLSSK